MKKIVTILTATMMLFVLFGCQSTEAIAATTEVVVPATETVTEAPAPAPAPEPEPVPAPEAVTEPVVAEEDVAPFTVTYEYLGYQLNIEAADGKAVITYPDWVTNEEAAAFFALEVEKYGAELDGILYMFAAPGTVEMTYPASVSVETIAAYAETFASDLLSYVEGFDIQPATV
ncbi:MAG: hypothetical protein IAA97_02480 [Spirochaetes bacterium]|uniref:Uncharacterized protein n=1 Tax=Candidatus Ornithospirochaeta stercoripullorum TaxID=2840899 RepID=A0A9D9H5E5_9SPIO|nr:hypothetical protein [Candidatus Ornithospirochaeta stercoripullorum]